MKGTKNADKQLADSTSQQKTGKGDRYTRALISASQEKRPLILQNKRKRTSAECSQPPTFRSQNKISSQALRQLFEDSESENDELNSSFNGVNSVLHDEANANGLKAMKRTKNAYERLADSVRQQTRNKGDRSQDKHPVNLQNKGKRSSAEYSHPPGFKTPNGTSSRGLSQSLVDSESDSDYSDSPIDGMNSDSDDETNANAVDGEKAPVVKRGPTMMAKIWNLDEGEKLPEHFNAYNQSVDNGELANFCGTVARNPKLTPIGYKEWRKVPMKKKDEIWRVVKSKFDLAPERRKWVLGQVGKSLRNFRNQLYQDNFHKYKSVIELIANPDSRTTKDEWEKLVNIWYDPKWQDKSVKAKTSRSKMKMPHTSGPISFARRAEMEFKKTGKRPNRAKLCANYHKHKNGKHVSPEAAAMIEKIEKLLAENDENGVASDVDEFAPLEGDILSQVLGAERNGRVRGMSYGVTPTMFNKQNCELMREQKQTRETNVQLKEKVDILTGEVDQLKAIIAEFFTHNTSVVGSEDFDVESPSSPSSGNPPSSDRIRKENSKGPQR